MEAVTNELKIEKSENNSALYFKLDGAIGAKAVHLIREAIIPELQTAKTAVLDFDKVTFLSSAGIGILVMSQKTADKYGCVLTIHKVPPKIHDILQMAGMLKILKIRN